MAFLPLETDYPSETYNPFLKSEQMDKVRQIVHPKLRPFHFQLKTYYLSDANCPTDNPSQANNPSGCEYGQCDYNLKLRQTINIF